MDYIKIRFGNNFEEYESRFEKTIEDVFRSVSPMFRLHARSWKPQMDIYETASEIFILSEISGVDKENLEMEINSRAVRISGYRAEPKLENATYRLAEIQYGRFERILYLPALIDTDKVSASYVDGFLKIRLTKLTDNRIYKIPITDG